MSHQNSPFLGRHARNASCSSGVERWLQISSTYAHFPLGSYVFIVPRERPGLAWPLSLGRVILMGPMSLISPEVYALVWTLKDFMGLSPRPVGTSLTYSIRQRVPGAIFSKVFRRS